MKLYSKMQQSHFAFNRTVKSQTTRFDAELNEPVNEEVLGSALAEVLKVFPGAAAKAFITKDKHGIAYSENNAPVVISHDDTPAELGTDETNGYLFRLTVQGCSISFIFFHALFDARGALSFIIQVLCRYLKMLGKDIGDEGIIYNESDLSDPAVTGTLEELVAKKGITEDYDQPGVPAKDTIFRDSGENELYEKDCFSLTLCAMSMEQVKKRIHELGTSPMILFFVLISQAMRDVFDVNEKNIQCSFAADLRKRYESRSQSEYATGASLYYTPEMEKLSLSEQLENAKAQLNEIMSGDNLLGTVKGFLDIYDSTVPYIDLTQPEKVQPMLAETGKKQSSSFFITNVGALPVPKDMTQFIKGFRIYVTPAKFDPNFCLYTYGDTLTLSYMHNSTDERHLDRIIEKLKEQGIDVRKISTNTVSLDKLGKLPLEDTQ